MNKFILGILIAIFSFVPMITGALVIELYWNSEQTFGASCPLTLPPGVNINDWVGPVVFRTTPAHTVSSTVSVNDANNIARDEARTRAIGALECVQMFRCTDNQTATASCPAGYYFPTQGTFGPYTYTNTSVTSTVLGYSPFNMYVYHSSTVSVEDACAQTMAVAQASANSAATNNCELIPNATSTPNISPIPGTNGFTINPNTNLISGVVNKTNSTSGSGSVFKYNIYRDTALYTTINADQTRWIDASMPYGSTHTYSITEIYTNGGESIRSNTITITNAMSFPTISGLTVNSGISCGTIDLSWTKPYYTGLTGYNIYRDGILIAENLSTYSYPKYPYTDTVGDTNAHTYNISAVYAATYENSLDYRWTGVGVSAQSVAVEGTAVSCDPLELSSAPIITSAKSPTTTLIATKVTIPTKPTILNIKIDNTKSYPVIAWKDRSDNEDGFIIERTNFPFTKKRVFTEISKVGANTMGYIDRSIINKANYAYRVAAFNSSGRSKYSEIIISKKVKDGYMYSILKENTTSAVFDAINDFIRSLRR